MLQMAALAQEPSSWKDDPTIKVDLIEQLTRDKFRRNTELRERLIATETRPLINMIKSTEVLGFELNDIELWGKKGKTGENMMGQILEKVRDSVLQDTDLEDWLATMFTLPDESEFGELPVVEVDVYQ